jgi:two-component system sensor histidine kinase KdpD
VNDSPPAFAVRAVVVPFFAVALVVLAGHTLQAWLPPPSVALLFVLPVLACAAGFGTSSGLIAAVLSFFAFNYFFIEPRYTFAVADPQEVVALAALLLVAGFTGALAGRMRQQTRAALRRAEILQRLYDFSGDLSSAASRDGVWNALIAHATAVIEGEAVLVGWNEDDSVLLLSSSPRGVELEPVDVASAKRCIRANVLTPASAPGWPGARFEFRPLRTSRGVLAALGLAPRSGARKVAPEDEQGLASLLRHARIALERIEFEEETARAIQSAEQEKLRSALLSSISHDLRTPLATILGSVTSLREFGPGLSEEVRDDLLGAIEEETRRLSQFVANLLTMTRLDAGLDLKRDRVDPGDSIRAAAERARKAFPDQVFLITIPSDVRSVRADPLLLEQVVANLLDNAARFSSPGRSVEVAAMNEASAVAVTVTDAGPGISADERSVIFDKFFTRAPPGKFAAGTGLGLAICKSAMTAMGGSIDVQSPVADGVGARFIIRLPFAKEQDRLNAGGTR